jgi:hypothetical protein
MKNTSSLRNGERAGRKDRRIAEVCKVFGTEADASFETILKLRSSSGTGFDAARLAVIFREDGSSIAHWVFELGPVACDDPSEMSHEFEDEVLLDDADVKCILSVVARFNRFFGSNLFVVIPDEWLDTEEKGGSHE